MGPFLRVCRGLPGSDPVGQGSTRSRLAAGGLLGRDPGRRRAGSRAWRSPATGGLSSRLARVAADEGGNVRGGSNSRRRANSRSSAERSRPTGTPARSVRERGWPGRVSGRGGSVRARRGLGVLLIAAAAPRAGRSSAALRASEGDRDSVAPPAAAGARAPGRSSATDASITSAARAVRHPSPR